MAQSAQVVEVIDHYQVRINRGSNDGISKGDKFELFKFDRHEHHIDKISKGIGEAIEVNSDNTIIQSVKQKTGGKKAISKTGSGEAFTASPDHQDTTVFVNLDSNPMPFSEPKKGDLINPLTT